MSGYLSQSQLPLYFGLGQAERSGGDHGDVALRRKQQVVAGPIEAGQVLTITEE